MKGGRWQYGAIERPRLVIVGAGEFAEIAYEYFTHDSPYEVAGFAVEREFLAAERLCGRPVVPFEDVAQHFPPERHSAFVAVTYTRLNRVRARLFAAAREKGYAMARYVSSAAFVWHTAKLGENCFVFEHNVVQHGVEIGDDVVLWSGNHLGHRVRLADHCYLTSHVVVSGYCSIGAYAFLGVNSTLADNVSVGANCLIGAGATVLKDVPDNVIMQGTAATASRATALRFFRVPEAEGGGAA